MESRTLSFHKTRQNAMSKEVPTDPGDTNNAAALSKGGTVLPFRIWQEPEGNPQRRETS